MVHVNKCIYYKDDLELTYKTKEHVISAGIGGSRTLPLGMVSDQANRIFSAMELEVLRNSPISLNRYFYGPGKRGSSSDKKRTKSPILIMESENELVNLGYLELGEPKLIPQIRLNEKNEISFHCNSDIGDTHEQQLIFFEQLKYFKMELLEEVKEKKVSKKNFVLGFLKDRWYMFSNISEINQNIEDYISKISLEDIKESKTINTEKNVKAGGYLRIDERYLRFLGKTAFNTFAYLYGHEIALLPEFDKLRNWIIKGGENQFVKHLYNESNILDYYKVPEDAHSILFHQKNEIVFAEVRIYGETLPLPCVVLTEKFSKKNSSNGFICDWKIKEEITLYELLRSNPYNKIK